MKEMNVTARVWQIFIYFFVSLTNKSQAESGRILIFLKSGHRIGGYLEWSDVIRKSSHFFMKSLIRFF